LFICLGLGFGPIGVIGGMLLFPRIFGLLTLLGSLAAGFQSYMYGDFTPAGGIFATLTSMAMLG